MITPELQAYISQSRASGMSDSQIRQALLSQGWNEADVDSALGSGYSQGAVPSPNFGAPVKGEKDLIWGLLLPIISSALVILNNIIVLGFLIPNNTGTSAGLLPYLGLAVIVGILPIIAWILIGRGCGRYSREKGYGAGLGWVLGLILSLLGLLILALLPNKGTGQPEKILTRRVKILIFTLFAILALAIGFLVYKGEQVGTTGQSNQTIESANPQYANATLPAATDKSTWTKFPGEYHGLAFSFPSNLFGIYNSLDEKGVGTGTDYVIVGQKKYWFYNLFAGQGQSGSLTVSFLLGYDDINALPDREKIFGTEVVKSLIISQIGNKTGHKAVDSKNGCSQIYYFVPGGIINLQSQYDNDYYKDIVDQGYDGKNNIVVINFDGCTTGTAVNNNQNYINSILSTFSIN